MRGIILAGGSGTRLRPLTDVHSKQLLPVYDKPMIYYPLSVLMQAGITEVLVISSPEHLGSYRALLGDGERLGISIAYAVQRRPGGIAEALVIGAPFTDGRDVCLILGDNIFHGHRLPDLLRAEAARLDGCTLFGHRVGDPERYGVATVDGSGRILTLVEKPTAPDSDLAVTGLYMYDADASRRAAELAPSDRGELEITDLNLTYVREHRARLVTLERGSAWFDTGTHDSLLEAAVFVQALEKRQGIRISCLEEVAYRMGYIDRERLALLGKELSPSSGYGRYVMELAGA
ncbi:MULTISPECIES: glucose-1-phosphate thymidylyltransferase RfbA [Kitasatospora]|uniref:Glucose-1-phosphate thymidylyltransferase n=1 Tax=Kitasatospora setae (strain ATCC 33774 / DSM 43861 / JCM 3304 / KCC A-0304 / NBRC 14216 / KM-6054) TaxID=452652 RepID=E4N8V1_KITSK|nr:MULTISPECIES: glucose-1-phosphate thymidylyltransferase RfbA [Kitasatospora]BAJ27632.1 putative glucose-1-phosphate thymidylyltransferase [Kitasatospora setae KM-6054]